jgi:hypothetical protein
LPRFAVIRSCNAFAAALIFVGAGLAGGVFFAGMSASLLFLFCGALGPPANFRIAFGASLFGESGPMRFLLGCRHYRFLFSCLLILRLASLRLAIGYPFWCRKRTRRREPRLLGVTGGAV